MLDLLNQDRLYHHFSLMIAIEGGSGRDSVKSYSSAANTTVSVEKLFANISGPGVDVAVCYGTGLTALSDRPGHVGRGPTSNDRASAFSRVGENAGVV